MMTYIKQLNDERFIKRMNEKGAGLSKSEVIKEETKGEVKIEDKEEESTRKRKLGTRKKMKSRKRRYIQHTSEDDSDKENDDLRLYLTIAQDEDKEVDYEILDRKYPIIDWKTVCLGTKPQFDESKEGEINLNVVTRSNDKKILLVFLYKVLSIYDREELNAVYHWSSLSRMLTEKEVIPLKKSIVVQMLNLKLESEEESTMALELIRFIKKYQDVAELLENKDAADKRNRVYKIRNHDEYLDTILCALKEASRTIKVLKGMKKHEEIWEAALSISSLYRRHCVMLISILVTPRISALAGCDTNHDQEEREYENRHEDKERCELFNDHELPVYNIRRFEMIKYSFGDDEEYVAVKEDEYVELMNTKDAIHAYREIFRMMDEGWMVTRA
ncbi:hypothetical protein Tco_0988032 [Tanacetum coccineum]|uniref:Uncharacterized protein n=1 Tax=Tanacetum coccineum TaxID=301880 RepID=A0ABQ5EPV0_9ASTR